MTRPVSYYFWILHQAMVTSILFANAGIVPVYLSLQDGYRMKDELKFQEKAASSMLQCATRCAGTGSCVTASFNKDGGACHLSEFSGDAENLISGSSWTAVYKNGTGAMSTSPTTANTLPSASTGSSAANGVTDPAPIGPTDPEPIAPTTTASNGDPPAVPPPSVCGWPPAPVGDTPPDPNSPPAPVPPPVECGTPPPPINTSPTLK